MSKVKISFPEFMLQYIEKKYPNLWNVRDMCVEKTRELLGDWPPYVRFPHHGWINVLCTFFQTQDPPDWAFRDVQMMKAVSVWKEIRHMVGFAPQLLRELMTRDLNGEIPLDVIYRLPASCIFVQIKGLRLGDMDFFGFFVLLDFNLASRSDELHLIFVNEEAYVLSYVFDLRERGIVAAHDLMIRQNREDEGFTDEDVSYWHDRVVKDEKVLSGVMNLAARVCRDGFGAGGDLLKVSDTPGRPLVHVYGDCSISCGATVPGIGLGRYVNKKLKKSGGRREWTRRETVRRHGGGR